VKAVLAWTPAVMCAVWALVRVFGLEAGYPAVPVVTYTLFVLPVAVLATAVALALRQWIPAALAAAAAVALAAVIAPRALGGPDSFSGMPVRVMSANVLRGSGDAEILVANAREHRVDLLCVQELTPEFAAQLDGLGITRLLPHRVLSVQEGVSGSGIYARYPLRRIPLADEASSSASASVAPGIAIEASSIHTLPVPASPSGVDGWGEALRQLPDASVDGPIRVLAGDFNATLDQSEFRDLLGRGYHDAGERMGEGLTPTWPEIRGQNRYLPVTIDHVLYDRDRVGVTDYAVLDLPGSDHRTVFAALVLKR
jgi:endonuclease/exonuclease/phosphatase (EEP) superfamily protein YafD